MTTAEYWYVDSSVVLRVVKEGSIAASTWFDATMVNGGVVLASRLMALEVRRAIRNARLSPVGAETAISRCLPLSVDDTLLDEAAALTPTLRAADAIHLASALRVGTDNVTIVTHDAQMAAAAQALGFAVLDPVTDDPLRAPVA